MAPVVADPSEHRHDEKEAIGGARPSPPDLLLAGSNLEETCLPCKSMQCELFHNACHQAGLREIGQIGYHKLHKLVYIHYSFKLHIQESESGQQQKEVDPCGVLMGATIFDEENPMLDWPNKSMSAVEPILYEGGGPSGFVDDKRRLNSKRKLSRGGTKEKKKERRKRAMVDEEDEFIESEDGDEQDEFEENSSKDDDDDHGDSSKEAFDVISVGEALTRQLKRERERGCNEERSRKRDRW